MFDLKGKVAIVTGASGGLGEGMAKALSNQGANVAILDIKDGESVAKSFKTKSRYYKVDITNEEEVEEAVKKIKKDFGKINILVNNAGIFFPTPIINMNLKDWDKIINVNLKGYAIVSKHVVPLMEKNGKIINTASVSGHHATASSSAYNASKAGVIMLTKTMAQELADRGILVNAICPGVFITPMTQGSIKNGLDSNMKSLIPLKRAGKPEELGGLAVYLASDENSYMTGSIINIDGGWTCHL